jgi:hypothetical protein
LTTLKRAEFNPIPRAMVSIRTAVVENRMLELKAETARQDLVTLRKGAAIGSAFVLLAAKLRGKLDAVGLAFKLLGRKSPTTAEDYLTQVDDVARRQYGHIDGSGEAIEGEVVQGELPSGAPRGLINGKAGAGGAGFPN